MRRIVSIILAAALFCLTLTACGSRQKTDLSGAKTIADLKGATIAAQAGTFWTPSIRLKALTRSPTPTLQTFSTL